MPVFRTEVNTDHADFTIDHATNIITIGSCFADVMGIRLLDSKFKVTANPFGTVYNPISIHHLLSNSLRKEYPDDNSYLENQEIHFNFHFHSRFSSPRLDKLKSMIREAVNTSCNALSESNIIIITYGTSFVFERTDNQQIVANCHKMPSSLFRKRLLSTEEIVSSFQLLHEELTKSKSIKRVILTVSPVRHIKDTLTLNSVSKSIIRTACHLIASQYPEVYYFPSYEIMIDDLRDYRFYEEDMIHPSAVAEDYLWEKFTQTFFNEKTTSLVNRLAEIRSAMQHRPFHPETASHQTFLATTLSKLEALSHLVPVDREITELKKQMGIIPDIG